ncbi:metallophosphoesterase [Streptomyces eurocidicus]|uniref:Metallophosphoesterase n=1 Tax=Streptomyces eurocidicus TaxID=66423 RepID=A0A2N8P2X5_STREU|nr:TIGR03767 family metallophosphoesterase [Streptomyces eurocidicus]MBB5117522.1 metallophosphoesterase (TIGR03767 family) [Streptomyces eurocidicus]MBF6053364.1 TIGR03767 family metallophosphoesterase [Streptomyces eurocidicus]PNE35364.1 metallophosphoesterase [Streptomyces eurocidicus]
MNRRSDRSVASGLDRRTFLAAAGAVTTATGIGLALGPDRPASAAGPEDVAAAAAAGAPAPPFTAGTTLASVAAPRGTGGYRRLGDGPGWPRLVRAELADAQSGRQDRRTALASFVQFTDIHLTDVQHPLRYEFFRSGEPGAWRPHEALTLPGVVSLVERVNKLRRGPATGAPLSFVITTGDNGDENARIEVEWFLTALSGGRMNPNTGDPRHYEGVQNSGLKLYWHPDTALRDDDKQLGFPRIDGYLAAATRRVDSPGLDIPWYSTFGNHDLLSGGCYPAAGTFLQDAAVGNKKLQTIPAAEAKWLMEGEAKGVDPKGERIREMLRAHRKEMRTVTPDPRRAPLTARQYVAAHLEPRYKGRGPVGHGYTRDNLDSGNLYYSFRISDRVIGISLDSTDPGGHYQGSLGTGQIRWLERTLKRYEDKYALVFSHHPSWSMDNLTPDPARPGEDRHDGNELISVLQNHNNVLAWINGHSHRNRIRPRGTFWEIATASHVDYPQLARVIEVTDNHDGTVSLFTTLIESAAPYRTDFGDLSQRGLASLYRELAFNAPGADGSLAGAAGDRNTELLLPRR